MRSFLVYMFLGLCLVGCGEKEKGGLKLALNWFPEAEHGGFYAAQLKGHYEKANLKVDIQPGGPDAPVIQKVASGQVAYGVANADDVLNARSKGAPIVAVLAPIQVNPRCIMVHEGSGIEKIGDIKGMTLAMSARPAYSHWLKKQVTFEGVKVVPYPSSIAVFLNDPKFAQQAYNISEPFVAQTMGAKPKVLMVSDLGFNPYCSVLITHEDRLKNHRAEVESMAKASLVGWESYLKDASEVHALIHKLNPEMPLDVLDFGAKELLDMTQPLEKGVAFGGMVKERWLQLAEQMKEAGLIDLSPEQVEKAYVNF